MILNLAIFRNRNVILYSLLNFLISIFISITFILNWYSLRISDSMLHYGLIVSLPIIIAMLVGPILGSVIDKYDKLKLLNRLIVITTIVITAASFIILFDNYYVTLIVVYITSFIIGFAIFLFRNILLVLRQKVVSHEDIVQFNVLSFFIYTVGSSIGSGVVGLIYDKTNFSVILLFSSIVHLMSIVVVNKFSIKYSNINVEDTLLNRTKAGLKYTIKNTDLLNIIIISGLMGVFSNLFNRTLLYIELNLDTHLLYYGLTVSFLLFFVIVVLGFYRIEERLEILLIRTVKYLLYINFITIPLLYLFKINYISTTIFVVLIILSIIYNISLSLLNIMAISYIHRNTNTGFMGIVFSLFIVISYLLKFTNNIRIEIPLLIMIIVHSIVLVSFIHFKNNHKSKYN